MATICLVNGVYPPDTFGGAENYVHRIATALQERGHDAFVLTTTDYEDRSSLSIERETYEGVPVYRFYPLNTSHRAEGTGESMVTKAIWHQLDTFNPHARRTVSKFLSEQDPDVVHTHNFMGIGASVGKAIDRSEARYVHTLHDYSLICPKSNLLRDWTLPDDELGVCDSPPVPCRLYGRAKRRQIGTPDLVVGPSQHVIDIHSEHGYFKGVESMRLQHGIESFAEDVPESTADAVLYAGKHLRAKGLETLFEAARELPDVTFHLCGTGPYDDRSQEVADELGNVKYHGYVSEERLQELRREVAAAVVPSIWMENSPLTIYESFAQGLPVIGSDIGGIPELIKDGETGFLFEPESAAGLKTQIKNLLSKETDVQTMRKEALAWARGLPMESHINALIREVYELPGS